jgi:hypothetical protein
MPRPPHSPWFDLPNNIRWWVQIMKLPIVQLSPFPCYFFPLGPNILLSTLFPNTLSLCSSLNVRDQVSHPYKTTCPKHFFTKWNTLRKIKVQISCFKKR